MANETLFEPEFYDILKIFEDGAKKYGKDSWLESNGTKTDHKSMHDSMFHHLAESYAHLRVDKDSGLDPLLHLATRALMLYTRIKREIHHEKDIKKNEEESTQDMEVSEGGVEKGSGDYPQYPVARGSGGYAITHR